MLIRPTLLLVNSIGRSSFVWPIRPTNTWAVVASWGQDADGTVQLVELHITPRPGDQPPPMTPELFAQIGKRLEEDRQSQIERIIAASDEIVEEIKDRAGGLYYELLPDGRHPLLGRMNVDQLVEVATIYAKAHASGGAPTQAVADHFGIPRGTATSWVKKARKWGLLDPASGPMARSLTISTKVAAKAERAKAAKRAIKKGEN